MATIQDYPPGRWVDEGFYLTRYPDVAASGRNAAEHYELYGRSEGRSPNALFDPAFYLADNPDVAAAGDDPLEHYVAFGWSEGRNPSPGFNTAYYLNTNPDVAATGVHPLAHYLEFGQSEGRRPLPPTFTAAVEDGTVRFAGTAVGDVGLVLNGTTATFTREGIPATVADFDEVDAVALNSAPLSAEAPALSGKAVTGGGALVLTGMEADTDLSGVAGTIFVTVQADEDLDLSGNAALGTVDAYRIAEGATLTLSAAQAGSASIVGSYAVRDGKANLFDDEGVRPAVAAADGGVTVTDAASIAELAALDNAVAGPLAYGAVTDAAANLAPGGAVSAFVVPGTDVTVTGVATLAQLAALDAANGDGALFYTSATGTAADLAANTDGFVRPGISVAVADAATIAQLAAIDAANGGAALAYGAVSDTAANLISGGAANAYVVPGTGVEVTGGATLAQLATLDAANGDGDLAYGSVQDTAANLIANAGGYVAAGTDVAVTGAATVAQLAAIDAANGDGDLTYAAMADTAANLAANAGGYVAGTSVVVTDAATVAQLAAIDAANGGGALAYTAVSDAASNLVAGGVANAYVAEGTDVEVTGAATPAQLAALDAANGDGDLLYASVVGAAADLAANADGYVAAGVAVEVADAATVAQLATIDAANGDGALAYGAVTDTAANLVSGGAANAYVVPGTDVEVTGAATVAQLAALDAANGNGDLEYTNVADALANLFVDGDTHPYVVPGTDVAATGEATVAQLVVLDEANGDGALTSTALLDTWQNILSDDAAGFLAGVGTIELADYDLGQATVAQVRALLGLGNLQNGDGDPVELADLAFTLSDTAANLSSSAPSAAEIVAAATAVEATDAASALQAGTIYARNPAAVYDIADSPTNIAFGDADAVAAGVDLAATSPATAALAVAVFDRDGPAGDVAFSIRDTFANTDAISAAVRNTATDITVTTRYLSVADANTVVGYANAGTTTVEYVRGTAAEVNAFVAANPETAGPAGLAYDFWVLDSASAILTAIGDGSAPRIAFLTGNAAAGVEGDNRAANIEVSGAFTVAGAETFWATAEPVFDGAETTSARTYYGVQDSVLAYDNESADGAPVVGADYLRVSDTAANIQSAQIGLDVAHSRVFDLLDTRQSGSDAIYATASPGNQEIQGTAGFDNIALGDGYDTAAGGAGVDVLDGGADDDYLQAGSGNDVVYGGAGADALYGEAGKDVVYAGASAADTVNADAQFRARNAVTGGEGGDNLFGSADFDAFLFEGASRSALRAEAGTTQFARDYVTNFALGDRIEFSAVEPEDVQFFGSGSANGEDVEPGTLALSVRYEKNVQVLNWAGDGLVAATRILVDVADGAGRFDDVADMQVILVGSDIDVNWDGYSILFGG